MKQILKAVVLRILKYQVASLIKRNQLIVIGITGSVGKTSTKLAVAGVLKTKYSVLVHEGNYNSEIGLPLSLFEAKAPATTDVVGWVRVLISNWKKIHNYPYQVAVLEMGADHPGDIADFMSYISPDIGVVTAVAASHIEGFGSLENILSEKWQLVTGSKKALVSLDFPLLVKQVARAQKKNILTYSISDESADYFLAEHYYDQQQKLGRVRVAGKFNLESETKIFATHLLSSVIVAVAVGNELGLSRTQIESGVRSIKAAKGRLRLFNGIEQTLLLDDTYNANSTSMIAALETLRFLATNRKVAVLGSINELGDLSRAEHQRVGQNCGDLDYLITIGNDAKNWLAPAAIRAGLSSDRASSFESPVEAGEYLRSIIVPKDTILFKGSQNLIYAEEALKHVLADVADSAELVRQSDSWIEQKRQQFSTIEKTYG